MAESNNNASNGLDADAILVIVGGTLVCAGGLILAHSPRVQGVLTQFVQSPQIKEMGRAVAMNVMRGIGESLGRWGNSGAVQSVLN